MDLFSRRIIGWAVSDRLRRHLALAALRQAFAIRRPCPGLTCHSDRGSQYCSIDYQSELKTHGSLISMFGKGNYFDNAIVETFFKTLKSELVWRTILLTADGGGAAARAREFRRWSGGTDTQGRLRSMVDPSAVSAAMVARQEARLFWPRVWIYVGLVSAIPDPGNILPFTIAEAGLHVERLPGGGLAARVNQAQQGGCLTVPQQCHGGTQLRCPQTACAFSRDRLPVVDAETPERDRLLRQFLGNRPDRLAAIGIREEGGVIRLRMRDEALPELLAARRPSPRFPATAARSWWAEAAAAWSALALHLIRTMRAAGGAAELHFPNLLLLTGADLYRSSCNPSAPR
jgi:hypothetical protein